MKLFPLFSNDWQKVHWLLCRVKKNLMEKKVLKKTAFSITGDGQAIIFIHGLGLIREMWRHQISAYASSFSVLSYDLLGHGDSARPDCTYNMSHFVDQLCYLVDKFNLSRFALVGFSLGGTIVRAFAEEYPERLWALAVLNAPYGRSNKERAVVRERARQVELGGPVATVDVALRRWFTEDIYRHRPDVVAQVRQWVVANDPKVYSSIYNLFAEVDASMLGVASSIRCPSMVLTAEKDIGSTPDMAREMSASIPGSTVKIVPRLKHLALIEDPSAVNSLLTPFIKSASAMIT